MKTLAISIFTLLLAFYACKKNKTPGKDEEQLPDVELKTRTVSSGLSHIWEMAYGPDQQLWITERGGKISRVNLQTGAVTLLLNVPDVVSDGEGGLLGMAINPQFNTNPWVYVVYNYNSGSGYKEKVLRYTYSGSSLTSPLVILDLIPAASIHNGSRLLITGDQKLLITTGDASAAANAQNTSSLSGKILRVNMDGSIPADNPIPNNSLWTYGHRNPQGLVQVGARLYASEHGPNNDDEVNLIEKGRNYGWPNVEGFCDKPAEQTFCSANNVAAPLMAWTPTIATSGLTHYNSDLIPQFKNSLLLLSLKASKFTQLKLNEAGDKILGSKDFFVNEFGRLRAICQSPDGKIYIGSSNGSNDKIIEIAK